MVHAISLSKSLVNLFGFLLKCIFIMMVSIAFRQPQNEVMLTNVVLFNVKIDKNKLFQTLRFLQIDIISKTLGFD